MLIKQITFFLEPNTVVKFVTDYRTALLHKNPYAKLYKYIVTNSVNHGTVWRGRMQKGKFFKIHIKQI